MVVAALRRWSKEHEAHVRAMNRQYEEILELRGRCSEAVELSATPRTDYEIKQFKFGENGLVRASFAKELERDVNYFQALLLQDDDAPREGWVLVPQMPTKEMADAGDKAILNHQGSWAHSTLVWSEMLAAAPGRSEEKDNG